MAWGSSSFLCRTASLPIIFAAQAESTALDSEASPEGLHSSIPSIIQKLEHP
jgi:hypothetical protein